MPERPELLTFDGSSLRCDGEVWRPERDLYAVLGHPVAHSRSPVFHNAALADAGIEADYVRLDVSPALVPRLMTTAGELGLRGGNVTVPLKELVASGCVDLSREARRAGAVNTFRVGPGGWIGHNTDLGGLVEVLGGLDVGMGWQGVVLGAGGSARAAVLALLDAGVEQVRVTARAGDGAQRTVAWIEHDSDLPHRVGVGPWEPSRHPRGAPVVVVVCVPDGVAVEAVLPEVRDAAAAICVDLRYGTASGGAIPGWSSHDGLGLLLAQGALAFRWIFGVEPCRDLMARALDAD